MTRTQRSSCPSQTEHQHAHLKQKPLSQLTNSLNSSLFICYSIGCENLVMTIRDPVVDECLGSPNLYVTTSVDMLRRKCVSVIIIYNPGNMYTVSA